MGAISIALDSCDFDGERSAAKNDGIASAIDYDNIHTALLPNTFAFA